MVSLHQPGHIIYVNGLGGGGGGVSLAVTYIH